MDSWYLLDESSGSAVPTGPFTLEQLRSMAASGFLRPDSMVAAVGASGWMTASSDVRLAGLFRATTEPQFGGAWAAPRVAAPPMAYSFADAFGLAWTSFTQNWVSWLVLGLAWLGCTILMSLPQSVLNAISQGMEQSGDNEAAAMLGLGGSCFGLIMQVLVGTPLLAGMAYAGARIHAGEGEFIDLFAAFRRYGAAVGSGALALLGYLGCVLVAAMPVLAVAAVAADEVVWMFLGFALTVCAFIVLMATVFMRMLFAPVIAIDPRFGPPGVLESFRISWRQTEGLGVSMLALLFVASLLCGLTILLLCVGYFLIGVPLFSAVIGAMYHLIHRARAAEVSRFA